MTMPSFLPLPRQVLSWRAEVARARTNTAFGWYVATTDRSSAFKPEIVVIPHMVSIAEDFARERLFDISEPLLRSPSLRMRDDIWLRTERDVEMTWEAIRDAWNSWHHVDFQNVSDFPRWKEVQGAIDARNAMMHGIGRLTRKQMRAKRAGDRYRQSMKAISIDTTAAGELVVVPESVRIVRTCVVELIERLDRRASNVAL